MSSIKMILTNGFMPDPRVYKEAKYLVQNGHSVEVLCWDRNGSFLDRPQEIVEGVLITRFHIPSLYGSGFTQLSAFFKFLSQCRKYLKNQVFDFIHGHDLDGAIICLFCMRKRIRLVFDMHEIYELQFLSFRFQLLALWLCRKLVKYVQNRSSVILYILNIQILHISEKNKKKLLYLPNYAEKANFVDYSFIPSDRIRIGFIGLVDDRVDFAPLFAALGNNSKFEIRIHGDGTSFTNVQKMASQYDNITLTGRYNYRDAATLYSQIDLAFITGLFANAQMNNYFQGKIECSPNKYYEALVTATPVITSVHNANADFIQKNEIGFAVDEHDVASILRIAELVYQSPDLIERMRGNLQKISDNYAWEKAILPLVEAYRQN